MNQETKVVKISDVVENQIPEFILSDNPNLLEFFKQYYISQEFQGSNVDLSENLVSYKNIDSFDLENLISETTLTSDVEFFDDVVNVDSTKGWPKEYGLFKIDNEIITYTGTEQNQLTGTCNISVGSTIAYISGVNPSLYLGRPFVINSLNVSPTIVSIGSTFVVLSEIAVKNNSVVGYSSTGTYDFNTNSPQFTGCIRGFSGTSSLTQENNPEFLVFSQTETDTHTSGTIVVNLSNLFLKEFFRKVKYQFTPGFEDVDFTPEVNPQNFISKAKTFYQSKGTEEAFDILFKLLYAEKVKVIKPIDYCFTTSDDKWRVVETFVCELVSGDPDQIKGQTLYQDNFPEYNIDNASGSIYDVESFTREGNNFYKIQIFSGYSNNLNPRGSIEGTFYTTPKSYVVETIPSGSNYVTVDSTVGFENSGKLEVNGLTITYTDKTNNQFLNCSGITQQIPKKSKVFSNHFVYAFEKNSSNVVKFKLRNVLSSLKSSDILYSFEDDPIQIDYFGSAEKSVFSNSLIYNVPSTIYCGYAVTAITDSIRESEKEAFSILNGVALCKFPHYLNNGDKVDLFVSDSNNLLIENINVNVLSENEFSVSSVGFGNSVLNKKIIFKRRVKKVADNSLNLTANIQDSYLDNENYYLTSNGLPDYEINPLKFETLFTAVNNNQLLSGNKHYFNTGDEVTLVSYNTIGDFKNNSNFKVGNSYYVNKINNNLIQISESRKDIGFNPPSFMFFAEYDDNDNLTGGITELTLIPSSQYNRSFGSAKLFKKFKKYPSLSSTKKDTSPGSIGIFVNGIELKNYRSFDKIYYGPIESVTVLNSGSDYNLLNPPRFKVEYDNVEYPNTEIIPYLKGSNISLFVSDPGFDYVEVPTVKVFGGNNTSIVTEVKMKSVINEVNFNATTKDTVINTGSNVFTFKNKHRFIDGEPIIYKTLGSNPIGIGTQLSDGFLKENSIYYVSNVGVAGTALSLAFTKEDAIQKTNLVNLRTYGDGFQSFISTIPKQAIDEVNVVQNDKDFEYKKVSFNYLDVNVIDDIITVKNHGFSTGEEVVYDWYTPSGFNNNSPGVGGLDRNIYYYVVKIDDDRFKLSTTKNEINYVNLSSPNVYKVNFLEYSPIRVEIIGYLSKSGLSDIGYSASIIPVVKGSVVSADIRKNPDVTLLNGRSFVDKFGDSYKNIINYEQNPTVTVIEGEGASFQPVISDGKITDIIVKNSGFNYFNSFELLVDGDGFGAVIQPIITNGSITQVKVVNGGIGYTQENTQIKINLIGTDVLLKTNLKSWTINLVEKDVDVENGSIFGENYSFKGNTYGLYFLNQKLKDLLKIDNSGLRHSPIVGWSYDGCPIYGPYAYKNADGTGGIEKMRSGYVYKNAVGSNFKLVEEYVFNNSGTLDKYNGRFCVTPEYPNGVYAYFCTSDNNDFPEFPYVIGPQYNCEPIEENFDLQINQSLNFNDLNITKCTLPYRLLDKENKYEYFEFFNSEKDMIITESSSGFVDAIEILDGGENYKIEDSVIIDNENTFGTGAVAKVTEISGVGVTFVSNKNISIPQVTFLFNGSSVVGVATTYHSLQNNSKVKISGISTTLPNNSLEGFKQIVVKSFSTGLSTNISSATISGIVTSIKVNDAINSFSVDTYLKIENEIVKVVGLDYKNKLLNVLRPSDGPSHPRGITVQLLENEFTVLDSYIDNYYTENNESYYFNPEESISIGTNISPGIGNTLTIYPLGFGLPYQKYVQTGGIYLPNNKFKTGDKIVYSSNGSTIITSSGNLSDFENLYVIKLDSDVIGLVSNRSDISSPDNILKYTSFGAGSLHKFKTDRNVITASVSYNETTVSTGSSHGLSEGDVIKLNLVSGITTTFNVSYSSEYNRVLINSQTNPKVTVFSNETVIFDLSSATLNNKEFNLYLDDKFVNPYTGNSSNKIEVTKANKQLKLKISDYTPKTLYYTISGTTSDLTVSDYNQIVIKDSAYNTQSTIKSVSGNQFSFVLDDTPEKYSYNTQSKISYSVISGTALGSIEKIDLSSKGSNYKKIPTTLNVVSSTGSGCNLIATSNSIGKIKTVKVNNTQFVCPTDETLRPSSNVFSVLRIFDNYTVSSLEIVSPGKKYINPPKIKLYNQKEDKIISDFSAIPVLKNNSINDIILLNPGYGLKSTDNQIIVTDNNNGFKIINASFAGSNPYVVTLTLQTPVSGFSTSNQLPISVGDEIYVENIASEGGSGFNSSDYKYQPFKVTYVDPAYGSQNAAIVRYELDTNPGSFDSGATYNAYVIPSTYIPEIKATLVENKFYNNETIKDEKIINNVKNIPISNLIKITESDNFSLNEVIVGKSSRSKGKIASIENFVSEFKTDFSFSETLENKENRGYLSSNIQKLADNDYYQRFSYSLKSNKQYSDWNSIVSDVSHIAGYKKFSDLTIESAGISTEASIKSDSASSVNVIINSYVDTNSVFNYDIVNEIDLEDNEFEYTEYLKFYRLKLGNSINFTNNRVLSIDDIANLFNTEKIIPKTPVDSTLSTDSFLVKYLVYLNATGSFFGDFAYPEILEVFVTQHGLDFELTSYSQYYDKSTAKIDPFLGSLSIEINPQNTNEYILYFSPSNPNVSVDIKAIKETVPNSVGVATTSIGYVKNVEICDTHDQVGIKTFYSIPVSDSKSGVMMVGIGSNKNFIDNNFEASFVVLEDDTVLVNRYTENYLSDLGTVNIVKNGSNIDFQYTGVGIAVTIGSNIKLFTGTYAGFNNINKIISNISSYEVQTSSLSTGISTIPGDYGYTKYIIEVQQDISSVIKRSVVQLNSIHVEEYLENIMYDYNGDIPLTELNFETTYDTVNNEYTLSFNPLTSADYTLRIYQSSLIAPN